MTIIYGNEEGPLWATEKQSLEKSIVEIELVLGRKLDEYFGIAVLHVLERNREIFIDNKEILVQISTHDGANQIVVPKKLRSRVSYLCIIRG